MPNKQVTWLGTPPSTCDLCGSKLTKEFWDGRMTYRMRQAWGCVCKTCFTRYGCGTGTGRGQHYRYDQASDAWVKVGG